MMSCFGLGRSRLSLTTGEPDRERRDRQRLIRLLGVSAVVGAALTVIAIFRSGHSLFAESLDAETVRETVIELAIVALVTLVVFVVIRRSRRSVATRAPAKTALILSILGLLSLAAFFLVGFIAVVLATGAGVLALESRGRARSEVGGRRLATTALVVAAISAALAVVLAFVA